MNAIGRYDDLEAVLRGELNARADSLTAGEAPYPAVRQAVRRDRTRRISGAASGLALVAVALAVTLTQTLTGGSGTTAGAASASAPSSLLTIPTRGDLAGDSAFVTAVKWRLDRSPDAVKGQPAGSGVSATTTGYSILYANDDGTRRLVVAAAYDGRETLFKVLAGGHRDSASALNVVQSVGAGRPDATFTYVGPFAGDGKPVPFVVLGPANMTNVEYSSAAGIAEVDGKLTVIRAHVTRASTVDGAASGAIPGATSPADAARLATQTVFRAEVGGRQVDPAPSERESVSGDVVVETSPPYIAIKAAVAQKGRAAGLTMNTDSPGGDAVPDNVAGALLDLARFDGVPIGAVTYQVDWIGRETPQWDAALLDISVPGLPAMQIFVRGLTAGAPDSASPGLGRSFVRPATALTPGHLPESAADFGGVPEPGLFGYELMTTW